MTVRDFLSEIGSDNTLRVQKGEEDLIVTYVKYYESIAQDILDAEMSKKAEIIQPMFTQGVEVKVTIANDSEDEEQEDNEAEEDA